MDKRLSWEEIEQEFDGEWVQLVDFDWDMTEPNLKAGVVRFHAKGRKELSSFIKGNAPRDSAIFYVGKISLPTNTVFNASLWPVK